MSELRVNRQRRYKPVGSRTGWLRSKPNDTRTDFEVLNVSRSGLCVETTGARIVEADALEVHVAGLDLLMSVVWIAQVSEKRGTVRLGLCNEDDTTDVVACLVRVGVDLDQESLTLESDAEQFLRQYE